MKNTSNRGTKRSKFFELTNQEPLKSNRQLIEEGLRKKAQERYLKELEEVRKAALRRAGK